eukprot:scaffold118677_cov51-Phaeocystis_antarctica.AAC.1
MDYSHPKTPMFARSASFYRHLSLLTRRRGTDIYLSRSSQPSGGGLSVVLAARFPYPGAWPPPAPYPRDVSLRCKLRGTSAVRRVSRRCAAGRHPWLGATLRDSAMGCGASNAIQPFDAEAAAVLMAEAAAAYKLTGGEARAKVLTGAALRFGQQFDLLTPMLVMPFGVFKAQRRIMKSTKVWRDQALAAGSLVVHEEGSGKVVIFISHTWWDRAFKNATNDPNNPYDKGAPDWQTGFRKKNRKWRVICAGVQRLIKQEGLKEEDVS